ncbi:MAG: TetR/AcrR family transcriptional regulator [Anaerolineaceae bacterium]|nr:TetR/AcrR family transcriptional regulator [Anaerolineaceae bacterium]
MNRKTDRRIQKTKIALRQSLIELIATKDYDSISIQDITNQANLGRATFYLHYKEKDELLTDCVEYTANEITQKLKGIQLGKWIFLDDEALKMSFIFARQNVSFYNLFMSGKGATEIYKRLHKIIVLNTSEYLSIYLNSIQKTPEIPIEVISNYLSGNILTFIFWWLENEESYPVETIIPMFKRLVLSGCNDLLYIDNGEII